MKRFSLLLVFVILFSAQEARSQDVENLNLKEKVDGFFKGFTDADPFNATGSFGLSLRSYSTSNAENRQSPFIWYLNGNLNVSIYKVKIPISAIVSAQNQSVSHPFHQETLDNFKDRRFNRIGASPYYKWVKLHLGHRTMHFSPLSVANHVFLGTGLELTPGKFRFGGFYGKMAKTEPRDLSLVGFNQQIFSRKGMGLKLGYGTQTNFLDFILFKAKDDIGRLANLNQDSINIFQNENAVLAINGKVNLFEKVNLNLEIASSGFTKNAIEPENMNGGKHVQDFLMDQRASTVYRKAINVGVTFNGDLFTVGMGYKRIEPEFRSLGTYFFNNDLENYTLNLGFELFKKKMRVNGTGGFQRNNLFGEKSTELNRTISSVNVMYTAQSLTLGLNYSNFSSDISFVLNPELDSLNAIIVTQNISLNSTYAISARNSDRHMLSLNLSSQQVTDDVIDANRSGESQMLNGVFAYKYAPKESKWKFNSMINYNQNELRNIKINRTGFGLGINRVLIEDKLTASVQTNYYLSKGENINNKTLSMKLSLPYTLSDHHRVDFGCMYLDRMNDGASTRPDFQEYTMLLNYTLSF